MKSSLECPLCGAEVDESENYCSECGETLKKE
ncbi:zinc-ribbon domain-containing protein [Candidatus Woesearchaeota archaeon]|nr:zinc-ribbon domain-containing protein [Candidatus Woesearchaeota archaeon]